MAAVPNTILLYNDPLLCGFNVPIKGLTVEMCMVMGTIGGNGSDNDYIMGMAIKVWEYSYGNGNKFPLQLFNVYYEILFSNM